MNTDEKAKRNECQLERCRRGQWGDNGQVSDEQQRDFGKEE